MRVLLATDLSESAGKAAKLVGALGLEKGSSLRVVSALEPPAVAFEAYTPPPEAGVTDDMVGELRAKVSGFAGTLRIHCALDVEVGVGRPADVIVSAARSLPADLVVMGHRGRGPFATALLGSVAAEVVDRAPCPVLVARTETLRRIVLAYDGSEDSRLGADLVTAWPFLARLPVDVVSVVDVPFPWYLDGGEVGANVAAVQAYADALQRSREEHVRIADAGVARVARLGVIAAPRTREGAAAHELIDAAREYGADLIVVGSRGITGLRRLFLGSVARAVLYQAPCSVLITRPPVPVTVEPRETPAKRREPTPA